MNNKYLSHKHKQNNLDCSILCGIGSLRHMYKALSMNKSAEKQGQG